MAGVVGQGLRRIRSALLLLSIVGAVIGQDQPNNCTWSDKDVFCQGLSLSNGSTLEHIRVAVDNCQDPVKVTLLMSEKGQCSWNFSVNGVEEVRRRLELGGWPQLSAVFSRNASHLHFQLLEDRGVNSTGAVLLLDVALDPSACMCQAMGKAANSTSFPAYLPLTHSCSMDSSDCVGFSCDANVFGAVYRSHVTIDPCTEVVTVTASNSSGGSVFQQNFSNTQFLRPSAFVAVYVIIHHYMYSVAVEVVLNVATGNATVLPPQQIILDRSSCAELTPFPGAPILDAKSGYYCSNVITTTTPPPPQEAAGRTPLVVAVAVPISLVVFTVVVVATVLLLLFAYIRMRKRREVQFRRMAFDVMEDDNDL